MAFIDDNTHFTFQETEIEEDDVFLNITGASIGRSAVADARLRGGNVNQHVCIIRPSQPELHPRFLNYFLLSTTGQKQIDSFQAGGNRQGLNFAQVRSFRLPLPPPLEQEAIAETLSHADAHIESLEQLIAKKWHIKRGAMQELLTGKRRLSGFEVKSGFKQNEVGEIPEDWEVESLSAICSMKSGESITSTNIDQVSRYPCYGGNGLRGFTTRFTHDGRYSLIGRQGALCGNVLGVEGKLFASEHAIVVTAFMQTDIRWLTFILDRMRLNRYSESSAQPGLSVSKLLSLNVAHPATKAEQEGIATILSDMAGDIAANEGDDAQCGVHWVHRHAVA
jgi:type I restriction enzyme S subunit